MASGDIQGKVNIGLFKYRGVDTDTAKTAVDNVLRTISVDVDTDEVIRRTINEIQPKFDAKQDKLVSGENIKTVNGKSLLGEGNIDIEVPTDTFVDLISDQTAEGDKTWLGISTFNDNTIFNEDVFIGGELKDKEDNSVAIKNISLATNIENGEGNGSLIQTNTVLMSGNEWSSSDDSIVTVDETGNVEAVAPGEATITCLREGAEATCLVTVKPRLLFNTLNSTSIISGYDIITDISQISSEDEIYLVAVSDNYKKQFSGNIVGGNTKYGESVDIVDNVALFTPLTVTNIADNEFTICYNGDKYLYWTSGNSLNAGQDLGDTSRWLISFEGNNALILNKSDTTRKIQYNSSSPRFACYNNAQASVMLVKPIQYSPIESLTLDEHELELDSGNEFKLSVEILPEDADKRVTWSSSDSSIVSVDNEGNLTAGLLNVTSTATITVTSVSDPTKSDSCEVTVKKQNGPAIKLSSGHLKLRVGDTVQLIVKYAQTNIASGNLSIALGHSNNITGNTSTAIGSELTSSYDNQIIIGKYNYNKNNTLFEVGNGTSENRSNALEVYNDGSVRVYKSPSNNNDITNKIYVDAQVSTERDRAISIENTKANDNAVVHLTGDEEIGGTKTFDSFIYLPQNYSIGVQTGIGRFTIRYNDKNIAYLNSNESLFKSVSPLSTDTYDLGSDSFKWRDLYLTGKLRDGKNSDYGLVLPNTSAYTTNKLIATEDFVNNQLSTGLSSKLDKITDTSDAVRVYAINTSGIQTTRIVSRNAAEDSLVERGTGGVVKCGTPVNNNDATNKQYVDTFYTTITGYDATKNQTLKNIQGTLTWVDD